MRRLRRLLLICAVIFLGVSAWLVILLSSTSRGELLLSRQLVSGRIVARVQKPRPILPFVRFGTAQLRGKVIQEEGGEPILIPAPGHGVFQVSEGSRRQEEVWWINLDPRDKSWDLEITESRPVFLAVGDRVFRLGTKTRVWTTHRRGLKEEQ